MRLNVKLKSQEDGTEQDADLFDDVTIDHLQRSQETWRPIMVVAAEVLKLEGRPIPRYKHWDWRRKADFLGPLSQ